MKKKKCSWLDVGNKKNRGKRKREREREVRKMRGTVHRTPFVLSGSVDRAIFSQIQVTAELPVNLLPSLVNKYFVLFFVLTSRFLDFKIFLIRFL